ncbi:MAG: DUF3795 domain-containing protein [Lachnospiraceae bacterium]|nr:DUF3795 domain-containing protein [Lachnospiraceae bacterium]
MNDYIAYCGLDCETCEARLATINNDNELRIKVSKEWSALNGVEITPEMMLCEKVGAIIGNNPEARGRLENAGRV